MTLELLIKLPSDNANLAIQGNVSMQVAKQVSKIQNLSERGSVRDWRGFGQKLVSAGRGNFVGMSPTGRDGAVHLLREESVDLLSTRKRKEQACKARS